MLPRTLGLSALLGNEQSSGVADHGVVRGIKLSHPVKHTGHSRCTVGFGRTAHERATVARVAAGERGGQAAVVRRLVSEVRALAR